MGETTLYAIACEMLRQTNPYKKDVSKISYKNDGEEVSLLNMVRQNLSSYRSGPRNHSKNNIKIAYDAISEAMEDYLYYFHSSFCFKQNAKKKFHFWLKAIQQHYRLESTETPFEIDLQSYEQDTCIAMLKALHSRDGVSEEEFPDIKPRSVRQNLRKLSPSLYKGEKENIQEHPEYVPFRIGGQQVAVDVKIKKRKNDRKQYYYTPNTVHPIVLQENLMQVGALLQSLCRSYYDLESDICLLIAIDIWSQLSDYAKEKIKNVYTIHNQDFREFVEILEDECPDDYASTYHTEREMAETEDFSIEEKLLFLAKAPGRTATIVANIQEDIVTYIQGATVKDYGENAVAVLDADNIERILMIANIRDIILD